MFVERQFHLANRRTNSKAEPYVLGLMQQFSTFVVRWRWLLFAGAALLALIAFYSSQRLDYDRSIENMFSPADPVLQDFRAFERVFGKDQIVLVVYQDPQLLHESGQGIDRAQRITDSLLRIEGVADVLSVAVLDRMLRGLNTSLLDREDALAAEFRELFTGYTHSADGKVAAAVCVLDPRVLAVATSQQRLLTDLRRAANNLPDSLAHGVLVGEPVMVNDGFRYVEEDGKLLGRLSTILLAITMLICIRSPRWVLIALIVVGWSTLTTQAILVWGGWRLSMVSSMLSAIITVIGVATVMHLALGFRDRMRRGISPPTAFQHTFALLIAPITWACLTDAAGFVALVAARAGPIRDFGFMMTLGSLIVLVAVVVIVPALALVGQRQQSDQGSRGEHRLERALMHLMVVVERNPMRSSVILALLLLIGFAGMAIMKVETDFTRNFRATSPIATAYQFVEQRLGGAGVWDVMIPAPKILTDEYLEKVARFENALRKIRVPDRDEPALTKVLSFADALNAADKRALLSMTAPELRARSMSALLPQFVSTLRAQDPRTKQSYLRVMLRAHDRRDAHHKQWLIGEVKRIARLYFRPKADSAPVVTGSFVLLTNLVAGIVRDQWICLSIALAGVGLAVAIAVRSVRLAVIALIVNTLPVSLLLGGAGWLGIRMNMGAAMIGAVSMGLSVDSSLHYLYAFQRALREGSSFDLALQEAQKTVGRALLYATIALAIGFASLCASQFIPTVSFGALSALTLIGSLLSNLMALPLLVRLAYLPKKSEAAHDHRSHP